MIGIRPIRNTNLTARVSIHSAPALAAAIRETDRTAPLSPFRRLLLRDALVPMYQVEGEAIEAEAEAAVRVLSEISERLFRLRDAYAEWREFDAGAYFDLTTAQTQRLVRIIERVATVHVTFYVDLLLPSFQRAEQLWAQVFYPTYHQLHHQLRSNERWSAGYDQSDQNQIDNGALALIDALHSPATQDDFATLLREYERNQEMLVEAWERIVHVMRMARAEIRDDINFWTTNGAEDERIRWRATWRRRPALGLDLRLRPDLPQIPSLTLSIDLPLPVDRQSGRLRRLRLHRDRRRRWKSFRAR